MDALWLPVKHRMSSYIIPFFSLSYPTEAPLNPDSFQDSSYFGIGPLDLCLVIGVIAALAILRDAFRLWLFEPFARWVLMRGLERRRQQKAEAKVNGSSKSHVNGNGHSHDIIYQKKLRHIHRSVLRFAEQGWQFVYYATLCIFGLVCVFEYVGFTESNIFDWQYVNWNLPTRLFHATTLWVGYPHTPLPGPVKFFYLTQFAFYLHQILILHAEARRKDHFQMLAHHVITIILMALSYRMNFTRVGCLTIVLMDWCDIFLPVSPSRDIRWCRSAQI